MITHRGFTLTRRVSAMLVSACALALMVAAPSYAGPVFKVSTQSPDSLPAGEKATISMGIQNVGDAATSGTFTVADTVGAGLTLPSAGRVEASRFFSGDLYFEDPAVACQNAGSTVTCTVQGSLPPGTQLTLALQPAVSPEAIGTLTNSIAVSGGGAAAVSAGQSMTVGPAAPFGFDETAADLLGADGSPASQAASDPAQFTTRLHFRTFASPLFGVLPQVSSVEHFKDVTVQLPAGLLGNPSAAARCTAAQLVEFNPFGHELTPSCPPDSQVGFARLEIYGGQSGSSNFVGLYNMVPPAGVAAEFAFNFAQTIVTLEAHVRPDGSVYILSRDTSTTLPATAADITVWGVPADPSHDLYRDTCIESGIDRGPSGRSCPTNGARRAFLRLPTSCSGAPLAFSASSNSYEHPGVFAESVFSAPGVSGCEVVPFDPGFSVVPSSTVAGSPSGLDVDVSLPQNSNPDGLAESDLRRAVVTLPAGMTINPSSVGGLGACTDSELGLGSVEPASCPDSSKIGTVSVKTPLLEETLEGSVFLRTQNSSDPASGEMYRMAVELRDDARGVDIKLPGKISVDSNTGRVTTTFDDVPQQPFSDFHFHFKSGPRAPLIAPPTCGPQTMTAQMTGWSGAVRNLSSTFSVDCPGLEGFSPSFTAGTLNPQAGGFSPFTMTLSRPDGQQTLGGLTLRMPPGLLGVLKSVSRCPEPQASQGACDAGSLIGHVTTGAGAGPDPFYIGGNVFLTGPYGGAPFGLAIVVRALAGPFDLGTVVVRAKVMVDPHTAQITVVSDPFPTILGGVPLYLRTVNVLVDRAGFIFNPTSCDPSSVDGTVTSTQGASVAVSDRFQAASCASLGFHPSFRVSTKARTSKKNGAFLDVRVGSGQGQANIGKVAVSLPKQLPSRLTTIQQACPQAVFAQNPASCPVGSNIGVATATTPILANPVTGPAYLVSHGGAAFPDLVLVLQAEGVTVDLVGSINIKKGVTSSAFNSVPDVPISTFELSLPQGPHSALGANVPAKAKGSLCGQSLVMPTTITGQNGAQVKQSTKIAIAGCPKVRKARKHARRAHGKPAKRHTAGGGK